MWNDFQVIIMDDLTRQFSIECTNGIKMVNKHQNRI